MNKKPDPQQARYLENVGHEPADCPPENVWQWKYTGTAQERELLLDLLQEEAEQQAAENQESLF